MKSRAELAEAFRKLASEIDQDSGRIPDEKSFVLWNLAERGLTGIPIVGTSSMTAMIHDKMKESFFKAVVGMRRGQSAAFTLVAFEEAVEWQKKFHDSYAIDVRDLKKAS